MDARAYIQYVVLEQLDALGVDGVSRAMAGFAKIDEEAESYAERVFESYVESVGEGEPGDFVEEATGQGAEYWSTLKALRQAVLNLLAVGLYHLFEQHLEKVAGILRGRTQPLPDVTALSGWQKIYELRLVANTAKHADGSSAEKLRSLRPDLLVDPVLRGSPLEKHVLASRIDSPMGGKDLFVTVTDLTAYRDALRQFWEGVRSII